MSENITEAGNVKNIYPKLNIGDIFSLGNSIDKKIICATEETDYFKIIFCDGNSFNLPLENLKRGEL